MATDSSALITSATDPEIANAMQTYNRLAPLKDALGIASLTDAEMQLFAMVANHTGLDPFTKQIYAIKRGGKVTHQTGIDGYRSSAERTRQYRGSDAPEFEGPCECGDKDSPTPHPRLARVTVYRAYPDGIRPQVGEARWHELKPKHYKPEGARDFLDSMWWQMPENQLAKCAEANGLRKAFPRVLGGVYITEEMEQADTIEGNATVIEAEQKPTAKDRVAARAAALKEQPQTAPEPVDAPAMEEAAPVASEAVCGATPGDLGGDDHCTEPVGHAGPHKSPEGVWPNR